MIRITAGKYKNSKLKVPDDARPLTDRIRLSLFDLIKDFTPDAKILDLYAGSGVTGLEALSRGGQSCVFIDNERKAVEIIKNNVRAANLGEGTLTEVIKSNAKSYVNKCKGERKFDLIFLDPPFDRIFKLDINFLKDILAEDGLIAARLPKDLPRRVLVDSKMERVYQKNYGKSQIIFYK